MMKLVCPFLFLCALEQALHVRGDGCDFFNMANPGVREAVLQQPDTFVPPSMKQTIRDNPHKAFTGHYDCHIPDWSERTFWNIAFPLCEHVWLTILWHRRSRRCIPL